MLPSLADDTLDCRSVNRNTIKSLNGLYEVERTALIFIKSLDFGFYKTNCDEIRTNPILSTLASSNE